MTLKNALKLIQVLLILIAGMAVVNSATGLNIILSSQDPDPVSPGNFVYLNVKVSNTGSAAISNLNLEMVENDNFKIAQGSSKTKALGTLPAYSTTAATGFVIAKYKVYVSENAPQGLNTIKFVANSPSGLRYEYDLDLLVQDSNPVITVNEISVNEIEPGKMAQLTIEVENTNKVSLSNIVVTLGLDTVENMVLSIDSGSNQKKISSLNPGEKKQLTFNLVASPDALAKPYLLPVTIAYEDSLKNAFTSQLYGSVRVYSKPILSLNVDSQDIFTTGTGKVTLAIANPGTSTIKGTQVEILSSDDYSVLSGGFQYVGDLNPDDFQTVQSEIYTNVEGAVLKVKVTYSDSYNNVVEKVYNIKLKSYNAQELKAFGVNGSSSSSGYGSYIVTLILIVVSFFVGRRFGYNKGKGKKN